MSAMVQYSLFSFEELAVKKPWCSDDLSYGLRVLPKAIALKKKYIQPNGPTHKYWVCIDVDREGAGVDWEDRGAPEPSIIVINPENKHAHLMYLLETPVRVASDGSGAALRYLAAVENALVEKVSGDRGYSGLIVKNPLHPAWQTIASGRATGYDLNELCEWVDLSNVPKKRKNRQADYGLGRNCNLFDGLREWAYKAIRQGWPTYNRWLEAVTVRAVGINAGFNTPLAPNEVLQVAKSVAKWTYKNVTEHGFSEWQAVQGRKGGKAKGAAYADKAALAIKMRSEGKAQTTIAAELGVSRMSVSRWLNRGVTIAISDNSPQGRFLGM